MAAARVAATFHLDPVAVLDANDVDWVIRIAANNVAVRDENRRGGG